MMKRLSLVILIMHCVINAFCNQNADWKKAEILYADKQYADAANIYASMFQYGESAELYYNYANALYKSNQIGLAILNYERALRLDPMNEDIKFNLEFVNRMKIDKIEDTINLVIDLSLLRSLQFLRLYIKSENVNAYLDICPFSVPLIPFSTA